MVGWVSLPLFSFQFLLKLVCYMHAHVYISMYTYVTVSIHYLLLTNPFLSSLLAAKA